MAQSETIAERFSGKSPSYRAGHREPDRGLYAQNAESGTIAVKRQLWETLLTGSLGEIAADFGSTPSWTMSLCPATPT